MKHNNAFQFAKLGLVLSILIALMPPLKQFSTPEYVMLASTPLGVLLARFWRKKYPSVGNSWLTAFLPYINILYLFMLLMLFTLELDNQNTTKCKE